MRSSRKSVSSSFGVDSCYLLYCWGSSLDSLTKLRAFQAQIQGCCCCKSERRFCYIGGECYWRRRKFTQGCAHFSEWQVRFFDFHLNFRTDLIFLIACRVANFALWSFGMKLWNVYNFISIFSVADVYLYGGCITSWRLANGKDLLFVRPDAVFNKKKPIRFLPAWFSFRLFLLFYVSIARSSIPGK